MNFKMTFTLLNFENFRVHDNDIKIQFVFLCVRWCTLDPEARCPKKKKQKPHLQSRFCGFAAVFSLTRDKGDKKHSSSQGNVECSQSEGNDSGEGGGYSPIWAIRGRAAG